MQRETKINKITTTSNYNPVVITKIVWGRDEDMPMHIHKHTNPIFIRPKSNKKENPNPQDYSITSTNLKVLELKRIKPS
jgi:hypothetical protein